MRIAIKLIVGGVLIGALWAGARMLAHPVPVYSVQATEVMFSYSIEGCLV